VGLGKNISREKDIAPGEDILREGWWIKSGDDWEVDTLYRKKRLDV